MKSEIMQKAFENLSEENKKMLVDTINKYGGAPSLPQALFEYNNSKTETEKEFFSSCALAASLFGAIKYKEYSEGDGKEHTYIVAMRCGGVMEDPDIHYEDRQVITAMSEKEAEDKYNKKNKCSYYYGKVIGKLD